MGEVPTEALATSSTPLAAPVAAMFDPAFYPERPASVEFKQTHISYVFLAGEFVYKVKKPVRFPFLDASQLKRRYELCRDEVQLNRRLAPEIYLDVVPIVRRAGSFALGAPQDTEAAEEFAVKMRRLDERRMLDRLVIAGDANGEMIRSLARQLADFHRAASVEKAWNYASAALVWSRVIGDLRDYESFAGYTVSERMLAAIEDYCRAFLASRWEVMNERAQTGRVRECHGDLRAEQIWVNRDGTMTILDCVEFSEALRYCDVASEIGFLAMDLDRLGAPFLAQELVSAYASLCDDQGLAGMLPFYKCYRACIRGMVESRRSLDREVSLAEREAARAQAEGYFALAHRYTLAAAPALVVVCGLVGTGKSTVAHALRERVGFELLNSDRVRKELAGIAPTVRAAQGYAGGIYSEEFNWRTYEALVRQGRAMLESGRGVILDATFKNPANRVLAGAAASGCRVPVVFVECRCSEEDALGRLAGREHDPDSVSDATPEVYLRQRAEFVPLTEISPREQLVADTSRSPVAIALAVERHLVRARGETSG